MKKLLLFSGVLLFCSGVVAQQRPGIKSNSTSVSTPHRVVKKIAGGAHETVSAEQMSALKSYSHPANHTGRRNGTVNSTWAPPLITETVIGTSVYDLQTNGTLSNRVINVGGKISATWTMSLTGNTTSVWPDRGTGYNYSGDDGVTWGAQPTARLETFRTGFQNVASVGNYEAIMAHTSTALNGEPFESRPQQGTGAWSVITMPGTIDTDLWPKLSAGGATGHSFHAIWQGTGTASGPLYYSRSTDDGVTWTAKAEIPGYIWGTDIFAVSADCYAIDVRGDEVAIVVGDFGTDVTLLRSHDNGATWSKRIVDEYPIPMYDPATMNTDTNGDGIADTLWSGTSDATVILDNNNKAHVFFGRTRSIEDPGATGLSYFFTQDLCYWNEDYADRIPSFLAGAPDVDGDGVISVPTGCNNDPAENPIGYYSTGLVAFISMPKASVDANNNIYLSYQAADEASDTSIYFQMFVHPYMIKSTDGGLTWTNPNDSAYDAVWATQPADQASYDGSFGNIARNADNYVHMTYQRDFAPGTTLSGTNFPCEFANNNEASNEYVYVGIPVNDIPTGSWTPTTTGSVGVQVISNPSFSIAPNYPNPFHGKTSVNVTLKKSADISIEVRDLVGRVMTSDNYSGFSAGLHTLTIDATKYAAGVYTYTVQVGHDAVTRKMIVQ